MLDNEAEIMESWHVFFLSASMFFTGALVGKSNGGTLACLVIGLTLKFVTIGLKVLS